MPPPRPVRAARGPTPLTAVLRNPAGHFSARSSTSFATLLLPRRSGRPAGATSHARFGPQRRCLPALDRPARRSCVSGASISPQLVPSTSSTASPGCCSRPVRRYRRPAPGRALLREGRSARPARRCRRPACRPGPRLRPGRRSVSGSDWFGVQPHDHRVGDRRDLGGGQAGARGGPRISSGPVGRRCS
jgi:hypothetical protein